MPGPRVGICAPPEGGGSSSVRFSISPFIEGDNLLSNWRSTAPIHYAWLGGTGDVV